jgi:hypothetical protein
MGVLWCPLPLFIPLTAPHSLIILSLVLYLIIINEVTNLKKGCNLSEGFKNVEFFCKRRLFSIIRVFNDQVPFEDHSLRNTELLQFAMALKWSAWDGLKPVFSDKSSQKSRFR